MARHSLGLYWNDVHVTACLLRYSMTDFAVEKIVRREREQDEEGQPVNDIYEDIEELRQELDPPVDTSMVALPERDIMYRQITRPFADRKKIAETLGPEIETLLPVDEVVSDFAITGRDVQGNTQIQMLCAAEPAVREVVTRLSRIGLEPEVVEAPSSALGAGVRNIYDLATDGRYVIMHMGWGETALIIMHGSRLRYLVSMPYGIELMVKNRTTLAKVLQRGFAASENDMISFVREIMITLDRLGRESSDYTVIPAGYAVHITNFDKHMQDCGFKLDSPASKELVVDEAEVDVSEALLAVAMALRAQDTSEMINFRQGDLAFTRQMERLKGLAGFWVKAVAAVFIVWLGGVGLDIWLNGRVVDELDASLLKSFNATMPRGTPAVDPVLQMQQYYVKLTGGAENSGSQTDPIDIIRDVSAMVSTDVDVVLDNLTIDESSVSLSGSTASYDNVDRIKNGLGGLAYISDVKIVSANVNKKDQRVMFKFVCRKG